MVVFGLDLAVAMREKYDLNKLRQRRAWRQAIFGGSMELKLARSENTSEGVQPLERLKVYLFGATVLFA